MNEKLQGLKATLRELEAELAEADGLDEHTRSLLEEASQEIARTLSDDASVAACSAESESDDQPNSTLENGEAGAASARSRLEEIVGEFETSHPTLFGLINRLVDALGQMGI